MSELEGQFLDFIETCSQAKEVRVMLQAAEDWNRNRTQPPPPKSKQLKVLTLGLRGQKLPAYPWICWRNAEDWARRMDILE